MHWLIEDASGLYWRRSHLNHQWEASDSVHLFVEDLKVRFHYPPFVEARMHIAVDVGQEIIEALIRPAWEIDDKAKIPFQVDLYGLAREMWDDVLTSLFDLGKGES